MKWDRTRIFVLLLFLLAVPVPEGPRPSQRIVLVEMKRLGWKEDDLHERRKGDQGKVRAARRLRQETTMSLRWIAQRLHMGSWTYVSNLLREKATN